MRRWRGIEATPAGWGRSVITIGVFDGVHRGHQYIIGRAVAAAHEAGLPSVVVTFDPHPSAVIRPDHRPAMLTDLDRRAALLADLGVDGCCVLPFTRQFSQLAPDTFVHDLLVGRLHAAHVVVGQNFRFGHKAAGDTALLAELGSRFGFTVDPVPLAADSDVAFSSTRIRAELAAGDVAAAAEILGRPHRVSGPVVHGADRGGSRLGFPTANVDYDEHLAVPADGVYAGWLVRGDGQTLPTAISVGTNPTFAGGARTVEGHVLDFSGDLYDEVVGIDFVSRLRDQVAYDSLPPLIAQMHADVARTRKLLAP